MLFTEIKLAELDLNPFTKIDEWALLTVGNQHDYNMMTITGLMMGQLWLKKTLTVYIHPARHSYAIMNNNRYFTVSFSLSLAVNLLCSRENYTEMNVTKLRPPA